MNFKLEGGIKQPKADIMANRRYAERVPLRELESIGDLPLTFVDFDATPLSIQDGEWQRSVNDSRYSAGSAIRRIGILHWTRRRRAYEVRKRKRERERDPVSWRKLASFSSYWLPSAFARTETRRFKYNRILLTTPDKEIANTITRLVRRSLNGLLRSNLIHSPRCNFLCAFEIR